MSEHQQEFVDRLLRSHLSGSAPNLSPDFDSRLAERLRPRRLDSRARLIMTIYALAAVCLTIWAMPHLTWSIELLIPALLIAVPLSFGWTLHRLERLPPSSARTPR